MCAYGIAHKTWNQSEYEIIWEFNTDTFCYAYLNKFLCQKCLYINQMIALLRQHTNRIEREYIWLERAKLKTKRKISAHVWLFWCICLGKFLNSTKNDQSFIVLNNIVCSLIMGSANKSMHRHDTKLFAHC